MDYLTRAGRHTHCTRGNINRLPIVMNDLIVLERDRHETDATAVGGVNV